MDWQALEAANVWAAEDGRPEPNNGPYQFLASGRWPQAPVPHGRFQATAGLQGGRSCTIGVRSEPLCADRACPLSSK